MKVIQLSVEIAFDHKPSHREMTSVLISDMYAFVVSETDIGKGIFDVSTRCIIL